MTAAALNIRMISNPDYRDALFSLKDEGWKMSRTKNGHIRLIHPKYDKPIFGPTTPSCNRSWQNLISQCRSALRIAKEGITKKKKSNLTPEEVLRQEKLKRKSGNQNMTKYHSLQTRKNKETSTAVHPEKKSSTGVLTYSGASDSKAMPYKKEHEVFEKAAASTATSIGLVAQGPVPPKDAPQAPEIEKKTLPASQGSKPEKQGLSDESTLAEDTHSQKENEVFNIPDNIMDLALNPEMLALVNKIAARNLSCIEITQDMVGQKLYYDGDVIITRSQTVSSDQSPSTQTVKTIGKQGPKKPHKTEDINQGEQTFKSKHISTLPAENGKAVLKILKVNNPENLSVSDLTDVVMQHRFYKSKDSATSTMRNTVKKLLNDGLIEQKKIDGAMKYKIKS